MKRDTFWLIVGTLLLLIAGVIFVLPAHNKMVVALPLIVAEIGLISSVKSTFKKH